jgi:hypothetical protein
MGTQDTSELRPGTLDLLILKALARGAMHGYGIAHYVKKVSDDVLQVGESSLYPHCNDSCSEDGSKRNGVPPKTTAGRATTR